MYLIMDPKGAADKMATTWEQIIIYVGTKFSEEITNALWTGKEQKIPNLQFPASVMQAHQASWWALRQGHKE